jgi:hypothetical protein
MFKIFSQGRNINHGYSIQNSIGGLSMRNKHVLLLVALVAFLLPATAFAASVNVDGVGTDAVANGVQLKSAIASAQPGDVVVIPEGTYSVDQLVVAPSVETTNTGISLKGAGVDSTKIELTAVSDGVKITGKKDFSFEGFTIDGMKKSNYPLRIQGCQNVSLKNITVKNANKSAFDVNGSTDVTGEGLAAVNAGGYGIALNDASGTFTSCTTEGSSWGGISVSNRAYPGYPASSNVDVKGIQKIIPDALLA